MGTPFIAAAYYRLSVEDSKSSGSASDESESIINQRNLVRDYCRKNQITLVEEFVDDGYSGSNFNRPGFQKLLDLIGKGKINMVITKDLSRLGRDMIDSGYYAEKFFPENGIRYIAIGDDFDSEKDNMMTPFKMAMNDVYLRETSKKIKQVMNSKRERGEYCACPPFGYMKDSSNKSLLVPDPATAPIVQRIFEMASNGVSCHGISKILTEEKVITPLKYRVYHRDDFGEKGAARATDEWNHTTVKRILKNKVYLGHTILGKSKRVSIKSKMKISLPEEEWAITMNTHEPLVSEEQFNNAERFMSRNTKSWNDNPRFRYNIFNGIIFCENCGAAMCSAGSVYKGEREKYWYLTCNNISHENPLKKCSHGARIKYTDLLEVIKRELNSLISLSDKEIDIVTKAAIKSATSSNIYEGAEVQLAMCEKRLAEIDKIIGKLYNDNIKGLIDDYRLERMLTELNSESKSVSEKVAQLKIGKTESDIVKDSYDAFFKLAKEYTHIEELTESIVRTFIERIEIGEKILPPGYQVASHRIPFKQSIKIYYRFIGNIAEDSVLYWNNAKPSDFSNRAV